ncbi:MAG: PspC domain-containing protein [Desulfurococcaceae archaeon]|nr:PspC domain-containing protein [Desulfurococcaceae archaeon]
MSDIKKLYRSKTDRIICNACCGIGVYVDVDPNIVRLLWVLLTIFNPFIEGFEIELILMVIGLMLILVRRGG